MGELVVVLDDDVDGLGGVVLDDEGGGEGEGVYSVCGWEGGVWGVEGGEGLVEGGEVEVGVEGGGVEGAAFETMVAHLHVGFEEVGVCCYWGGGVEERGD